MTGVSLITHQSPDSLDVYHYTQKLSILISHNIPANLAKAGAGFRNVHNVHGIEGADRFAKSY